MNWLDGEIFPVNYKFIIPHVSLTLNAIAYPLAVLVRSEIA
jgi:hypothetical protein